MIPFLQLDPITFTLWANQTLLAECANDAGFGPLVSMAYDHRYDDIKEILSLAESRVASDTAIRICSEVWHEKRHFLDLALTNYGSFRWRQGYQTYNNFAAIAQGSKQIKGKNFGVPLSVYSSRLACRELNVTPSPILEKLGKAQKNKAANIHSDNQELAPGISVGGDAQLEAMAYYYQLEAAANVFGHQETVNVLERLGYAKRAEKTHNWVVDLLGRSGLYGDVTVSERADVVVEPSPFLCLLFAALNGRFHAIDQSDIVKSLPALRLAALIEHFKEQKLMLTQIEHFDEAWCTVNEACKTLFGRSILEEIECDMDAFETKRSGMLQKELADEYVELRSELFDLLSKKPEQILHPTEYRKHVAPRLCPFLASSIPDGLTGRATDEFHTLTEFDLAEHLPKSLHRMVQQEEVRYSTHATISKTWPPKGVDRPLGMKTLKNWMPMINGGAAVVRLLESGMRWPTMCGLELLHAKAFVGAVLGKTVVVERHFEPIVEEMRIEDYASLTGSDTSICDLTEKRFPLKDCVLISPWKFASQDKHSGLLIRHFERLGDWLGMPKQFGHLMAVRTVATSWSPWVVHKDFGWHDDPKQFEKNLALAEAVDTRKPDESLSMQPFSSKKTIGQRLISWFRSHSRGQ